MDPNSRNWNIAGINILQLEELTTIELSIRSKVKTFQWVVQEKRHLETSLKAVSKDFVQCLDQYFWQIRTQP